jgi:hypothetical protein
VDEDGSQVESRVIVSVYSIRRPRGSCRARSRSRRPGDRHAGFHICRASGIRAAFVPAVLLIRDAYVPRAARRPVRAADIGCVCAAVAAALIARLAVCAIGTADTASRLALTGVAADIGIGASPIRATVVA